MILQISSGQGPVECELAVGMLFDKLKQEYPDIELLSKHQSRFSKEKEKSSSRLQNSSF